MAMDEGEQGQKAQAEIDFDAPAEPGAALWRAKPFKAVADSMHQALLLACERGDVDLCAALLSSGHAFEFNRAAVLARPSQSMPDKPGPAAKLPLILLAESNAARNPGSSGEAMLLEMIGRGASILAKDGHGDTAVAMFARASRDSMFSALAGHPEFHGEALRGVRIQPPPQSPAPLVGYLVARGRIAAVKALVQAGVDLNWIDPAGRLPIGYCASSSSVGAMIELGADPLAVDSHGRNALARIQSIPDTKEREAALALVSGIALAKAKASKDPEALDRLRSENAASALAAARGAPKSSLVKAVASFKFKPALVRAPGTGSTLLMEALRGGRLASAKWLMERGCQLFDSDDRGLSAAAILLSGIGDAAGAGMASLARAHASRLDLSQRSARGWPVALEAAFVLGAELGASRAWQFKPGELLSQAMDLRAKQGAAAAPEGFAAADGTDLLGAYAAGLRAKGAAPFRCDAIKALCAVQAKHGADAAAYDRAASLAVEFGSSRGGAEAAGATLSSLLGGEGAQALAWLEKEPGCLGNPMPRLARAVEGRPGLGDALAAHCPSLHALAEAGALGASLPSARPAAARRM